MGRGAEVEAVSAARAFMRPLAMLAVGAAAGVFMWTVLMADDGHGTAGHDGGLRAVLARLALIRR